MRKLGLMLICSASILASCGQPSSSVTETPKNTSDNLAVFSKGSETTSQVALRYNISEADALAILKPDNEFSKMYDAFGGEDGFGRFISSHSDLEIAAELKKVGVNYTVFDENRINAQQTIYDCPQFFDSSVRGVQRVGNQTSVIDSYGRPSAAYISLPISSTRYTRAQCQQDVGAWGRAENPAESYDGGHLIGYALGGWSKRANMAPQQSNFNQVTWRTGEGWIARCKGPGQYRVDLVYPWLSGTIIPSRWTATETTVGKTASFVSFPNSAGGGPTGAAALAAYIAAVQSDGCL